MQGTLLPGGRFTIFHYGEVLAVRFADPIDAVTVVASVPDFYQASAHVGCGCLRGFRRGRVVAVQQRSGCACRLG